MDTKTASPATWTGKWKETEGGRQRTEEFGTWYVEENERLTEEGVTREGPELVPHDDVESFFDVGEARAYAAHLLRACEFFDAIEAARAS